MTEPAFTLESSPHAAKHESHLDGNLVDNPPASGRCALTSAVFFGALLGLVASPCGRPPMLAGLIIIGVPLLTFLVAAPSRLGGRRELALLFKGLETSILGTFLAVMGRRDKAIELFASHRVRVENAYQDGFGLVSKGVTEDPARLHHGRRLANFATGLIVFAGIGLPFLQPNVFTFGEGFEALPVFALDVVTFAVIGRLVMERSVLRLFEISEVFGNNVASARLVPLTTIMGGALGTVGALVIVSFGGMACAVETFWVDASVLNLQGVAMWFIHRVAGDALAMGIGIGMIVGMGMGIRRTR
ncbi:MAG: hypothetical protein GY822_14055 [Deltaproteobacteria bacterium]|nr:hypothetical protein [Deltaproteobacteria bacterium]